MEGSIQKFGFDDTNARTLVFSFASQDSAGKESGELTNHFGKIVVYFGG
tara:strand:- start:143 stop:289 length:147 start_codon:yes stop_codon:yes gene_type:complete